MTIGLAVKESYLQSNISHRFLAAVTNVAFSHHQELDANVFGTPSISVISGYGYFGHLHPARTNPAVCAKESMKTSFS